MDTTTSAVSLDDLIPLPQAPRHVPGRPDVSCVWRWCRRGVLARTGRRVRLEHRRVGGKLFTSKAWIEAFVHALAEADQQYFDAKARAADAQPPRDERYGPPIRKGSRRIQRAAGADLRAREIEQELREEGL